MRVVSDQFRCMQDGRIGRSISAFQMTTK